MVCRVGWAVGGGGLVSGLGGGSHFSDVVRAVGSPGLSGLASEEVGRPPAGLRHWADNQGLCRCTWTAAAAIPRLSTKSAAAANWHSARGEGNGCETGMTVSIVYQHILLWSKRDSCVAALPDAT